MTAQDSDRPTAPVVAAPGKQAPAVKKDVADNPPPAEIDPPQESGYGFGV